MGIEGFFTDIGTLSASSYMSQYWYGWLIVILVIIGLIVVNVLLIYYFRKRKKNRKLNPAFIDEEEEKSPHRATILVPQVINRKQEGADSKSQFAMEALVAHNKFRTLHCVPPLTFNDNLANIAQSWADQLAKTQQMQHSPESWRRYNHHILGENLAYLFGQPLTGTKMAEMWYIESAKHDFTGDVQPETERFSQMVWKETKEVGFGKAKAQNGNWYYGVAIYFPPGNAAGRYRSNVFPTVT